MSSNVAITTTVLGPRSEGAPATARDKLLSTLAAQPDQRRLALYVLLASAAIFGVLAPFAKQPLAPVPAFLPVYQSALVINDLITAVLLFGQFGIQRARAPLVLASAYLFSAVMAVAHALSFPGLFAPAGLLGSGPQTTAWLYFFWHGGFPLLVIAYALHADTEHAPDARQGRRRVAILGSVAAVLAAAGCFVVLTTSGHDALPVLMRGDADASGKIAVASATWVLSLVALAVLWARRPHSVLNLWVMVTMCVWIFDVALASVLNAGRYDLGWYAGRAYGLLAASFVLGVLLLENSLLYAQALEARERERRRAQAALARHEERLRILHEIDRAIVGGEALQAIAGGSIQPLRELLGVPRAIVNIFDLEAGQVEWLAAAGRSRTHVGPGVRYPIRLMGDVEALKRGEPQIIHTRTLPPGPEVDSLLASGVHVYMAVPMISGGQLIGALSFGGEEASFSVEQTGIAREVATQLAIAISQHRLLERVRRHSEELELRVQERTGELQAANKELESFSYSVSHDLRAPLRGVIGFADALLEDHGADLTDEARRKVSIVQSEGRRMGVLIDELLAFSRLGRKALQVVELDMTKLAASCFDGLRVPQGGPQPELRLDPLPPATGDRVLLGQVWVNLLSNAVKFSSKREKPRIVVGTSSDAKEHVYFVRDNGAGFNPTYQSKLFGVFQRLHDSSDFPGTGVGLALVQRIVNRHGGRVWAESRPDEGATFYFTLPRNRADGTV